MYIYENWEYNMWDAFVDIDYSGLKSPWYYNNRESAFNTLKVDEPHHTLFRAHSTGSTYLHRLKSYLHAKEKQVVKKKKKKKNVHKKPTRFSFDGFSAGTNCVKCVRGDR